MVKNPSHISGVHAVTELLKQRPQDVQRLLLRKSRQDQRVQSVVELARSKHVAIQEMDSAALEAICPNPHQGVVAEVTRTKIAMSEKELLAMVKSFMEGGQPNPFLLILDGVTDPHNLGACLRTADAAGIHAVIVPRDKSAALNDTVSRVASGAAETVPLVTVTNLARCMKSLQEAGIWLIGTDDEAQNTLFQQDMKGPVAIVMGSEGRGLRRLTQKNCDHLVSIPMAGALSSLNVSVATGVALFEAVRQRG